MTVVLTGDVHQWIDSGDRRHAAETECALALEYARIAGRHGLKVTLFVTGLAVREDEAGIRSLLREENVEVGGHGWDSFRPRWRYRATNRLFGSQHGPAAMQSRMVRRTCAAIERVIGKHVTSWRNHAYCRDEHTPASLEKAGIRVWSDEVDRRRVAPYSHSSRLAILPINTTPDHEHLYHGDQTVETIPAPQRSGYDHPDEWRVRVEEQVEEIVADGGTATILAHPLCMKVVDDWQTFEKLCSRLSAHSSSWAREAASAVEEPSVTDGPERSR
jgi:hypothetical protein